MIAAGYDLPYVQAQVGHADPAVTLAIRDRRCAEPIATSSGPRSADCSASRTPPPMETVDDQLAAGGAGARILSGRGEAPGRWVGAGCGGIGVSGRVDRDGFMRAVHGCDPRTRERLRPEHGRTKVAAFDLTFSAPKSVSVLFAIGDEAMSAALSDAHERAVAEAFAYVEREACFTRRGRNGAFRVRGEGFVAAAYRHRLSPSRRSSAAHARCRSEHDPGRWSVDVV